VCTSVSSRPIIIGTVGRDRNQGQLDLGITSAQRRHADEAQQESLDSPKRGRPRLWASDAERKRAYRQRLAQDAANPQRLRRELRTEHAKTKRLTDRVERLTAELGAARRELEAAASREGDLRRSNDYLRSHNTRLRDLLTERTVQRPETRPS
jgi:hypothetical protein